MAGVVVKPCRHPDGCERPGRTTRGGWCAMHAARIERHGDPGPAQAIKNRPRSNGREDPHFGDHTFKGRGLLRCVLCDRPYAEHRLGQRCYETGP